ncbi:hypothetical protein UFOVP740_4 [uncultured Caudovirales phage]|uniref:Gp6 domain containing protein n=1 Tax=uncultured Caudovirales phage TaxID=2100421 RepID=A0A6J7X7Q5_9CAUD|nr:hypothetical protein UFOVP740_4 [uncultured Caudovirales phage]
MATYTVTNKYLIDNFAVLQLLTPSEIAVGSSITVASVDATFNGTFTVRALPEYLFLGIDTQGDLLYDYNFPIADQVLYAKTASDVDRVAASGTVTYAPVCTWVTAAQVMSYLGITITDPSDDYTLLTQSVSAGNQFCYRRRQESGYIDSLTTSPGGDATLGTLMYCAALWRSRGSIEATYATFDGMGSAPQQSLTPIVKQLLGIPRPAVA